MPQQWTASAISTAVRDGAITASEVVAEAFDRIRDIDQQTGAFLSLSKEAAEQRAAAIDAARAAGQPIGPLAGVPVAVKDNICTDFAATTCGSRMLQQFKPPYNATVIDRLLDAGAIVVGKTNLDEFAMGSSTEHSALGVTRNPWDLTRVAGGSSGGSAVAVSARMAPVALGSDTGGSIRQPASFTGVVGLKPTYGRVSRYGLVAYGSSLDQIGPLATTVADAALLLGVIAGADPCDATSTALPADNYVASATADVDNLSRIRIGLPREYFGEGLSEEVRAVTEHAVSELRALGAEVVELSLPHTEFCVAAYYLIAAAEASSNLARYDGVHYGQPADDRAGRFVDILGRCRDEGFGTEVKRRIMLGAFALSAGYAEAYYDRATQVRRLIRQDFLSAFEQVDVLACPASPTVAFKAGSKAENPLEMYLADVYTLSCNLAGTPGLVVPVDLTEAGMPVGLQLLGPDFGEPLLFRVGAALEARTTRRDRRPPLSR